ncbi:lysozyme family protein/endonuclease/exonuclease/phosphatase family metal-dependent hydrolase/predicted regulator of Ras-like GTPase activity (Roadblock/LC7/MglB family) [Bradyrhizobium sp. URHC0002]
MSTASPYVQKLVAIASAEFDAFHELDETDEPLLSRIGFYCEQIGIPRPDNVEEFPWSATFISWCVKAAGATPGEFKFNPAHAVFVKAAIANADAESGVFRARPVDAYAPKIGDIVHRNRNGGRITYKQARTRSNYQSHSAIVVDLVERNGAKFAITIGGNEGNSIRRQRVPLGADGRIQQSESNPYISVIEDLKVETPAHQEFAEKISAETAAIFLAEERLACDAGGEPEQAMIEAAPEKPPTRQEATTHKSSRNGTPIDHIVVHYTTSRNISGTISHFKNGTPRVSAHYIVGQDGVLVQMVPDSERAWHAGNSGMNARSIGIEHVARLGDKITPAQSATSIALIRFLMHTHGIPASNVIPHVCVKPTDCCGDLFKDFGGGAGLSCGVQKAAVQGWLASNGVGTEEEITFAVQSVAEQGRLESTSTSQGVEMAKAIVNFEARRDAQGRLAVYNLPPGDGGGRYEVAGINERYHKAVCDELVELIRHGRHAEAELRAAEFIASYTDKASNWTQNAGIEFYLRDTMFNRGPGGAAWVLQRAVGVPTDRDVGPITLAAARTAESQPRQMLDRLRAARESYERLRRDETSIFWRGLVNRWNKARQIALSFMRLPESAILAPAMPAEASGAEAETTTSDEIDVGLNIPFIDTAPPESPSFHDIGDQSPIDNPAQMLAGIRAFRNNVDFEVAIGADTSLPSVFLEALATQRRAVGKISTSGTDFRGRSGSWSGTGFLVAKNILLTNHHVLNSTDVAGRAAVDFTFEVSAAELATGIQEPSGPSARRYRLDPAKLFITSPVAGVGLDYTFVWIEDEAEPTFGSIAMTRASFSVAERERAFIIHHPSGRGRRVSLDENDVLRITTSVVRYTTDTMPGSSGSPVFNRQGRLIALHHASTNDPAQLPGGGATDVLNEGIKIAAIVTDLEARAPGPDGAMAQRVLDAVQGSDTMTGFFGSLGRTRNIPRDTSGVERVVDVYKGSENDIDIGFWNIEWLANRYDDPEKLRLAAFLIVDLGLDIWGLEEVSPAAITALVNELDVRFGEKYSYALSEPDANENKQSTAVIWKSKTVSGTREEWPEDIERLWHLRSTDDLGLEAVEGKIFDRYPGLFRFSLKRGGAPFEFYVVPLHLKAMQEGSKRRKLASRLLAHAVKTMTEKYHKSSDWVLGGDFNSELAADDFGSLLQADFVPLSAQDEQSGAFSYIKSPKSLIDHIFLSPNLAHRAGDDSYFIVAKEKSVDNYARKLSDHRPVLVRIALEGPSVTDDATGKDVDSEIARLLQGSPRERTASLAPI